MAIGFAKAIIGARQAGQLKVNFKCGLVYRPCNVPYPVLMTALRDVTDVLLTFAVCTDSHQYHRLAHTVLAFQSSSADLTSLCISRSRGATGYYERLLSAACDTSRAVALGDSWISPMDFVRSYSPFLKAWSLIDEHFEKELNVIADQAQVS